ncbi:hypothetical protein [Nitrosomonas eutropha]|uniref:Uncharacterized protein n=2 Tax=Nitrosomonas eutropha TaxID=916 RepID=A0ABX5M3D8_9PROT|nr:hypothetical protein [Nitrosomonas eutropha]ABI59984.1 conserved hypothetical protein [Nitrosomonas eutropha C91]PXV73818.1 hypothetical protein C8R14_1518 [Nitrosomonas eutropha]SCX29129.1 hypothetical protein SAMN05216379_1511 [Nitrosomonas eutropha]SDX11744.1 hypothetical protein SAMN05216317_1358 [Nitrosomonas eutropha]
MLLSLAGLPDFFRAQGIINLHFPELIPLDNYARPAGPVVNRLDDWYQSLLKKLIDRDSEVAVTEDQLSKDSIENIHVFTTEPECDFVFQVLDKAYLEWMNSTSANDRLRLLVFPPCDHSNRVTSWAEGNRLDVLAAPDRSELLSGDLVKVTIPAGSGPLVIPKLEDWFIRHHRGLRYIRTLLAALQDTSRHCLVSCNSWCWVYLKKAVNADLVLPVPDSLAPMNAEILGKWLLELMSEELQQPATFCDHNNGKEILRCEEDGTISDKFMQQLANDSGGIPWIAWQLWCRSLRTEAERDDQSDNTEEPEKQQASGDKGIVFWTIRNQPPRLPRGHEHAACLLSQALLIHGSLPEQMLSAVLPPATGESSLIVALIRSGFVECHGDEIRCLATADPVIWTSLANSGMTMARF